MMERETCHDEVERVPLEGEPKRVRHAELRVRDAGLAIDPNRLSDHGRREIYADDLADVRREGLREEARAAGHVERALAARGDGSEEAAHRLRFVSRGPT